MYAEMTLEQKFTFLLAKKLKGKDVQPEMDTLSEEELSLFKDAAVRRIGLQAVTGMSQTARCVWRKILDFVVDN
jgi:hypothetical protein